MGAYRELFLKAYTKSQKRDLHPPDLRRPERVPDLPTVLAYRDTVEMMRGTSFRDFLRQCGAVHYDAARAIIAGRRMDVPYVTIGDVLIGGAPRYKVSYQKLKQDLRYGESPPDRINCHVWLTFPNMIIFDLNLEIELAHDQKRDLRDDQKDSYVIFARPEDLAARKGFDYRPYLVGYRFLILSGMIEAPQFSGDLEC